MTNKEINTQIEEFRKKIQKLEEQKTVAKSSVRFTCKNKKCGKVSTLGKCDCLESYYLEDCPYTPRYHYSETSIICPHCRARHRLLEGQSRDKYILRNKQEYNEAYKEYQDYTSEFKKLNFSQENRFGDPLEERCLKPFALLGPWIDYINI